jgi:hypothetical protein
MAETLVYLSLLARYQNRFSEANLLAQESVAIAMKKMGGMGSAKRGKKGKRGRGVPPGMGLDPSALDLSALQGMSDLPGLPGTQNR